MWDLDEMIGYEPKRKKGTFHKGMTPFNKGKKWSEWMDGRKARRVKRILLSYRKVNHNIGGINKREVVGIGINGKVCFFESSKDAGRKLGILDRNIRHCCEGKRMTAGGVFWHWADEWNGKTELSDREKRAYEIQAKKAKTKERNKKLTI